MSLLGHPFNPSRNYQRKETWETIKAELVVAKQGGAFIGQGCSTICVLNKPLDFAHQHFMKVAFEEHNTMATPGKLEVEVETKSNPDKLWTALVDSYKIFPEAFPDKFKSIEILEGDGKAPGSVRLVKYAEGLPLVTLSKEKIETVDEASKTLSYSVIDGELINFYKTFKAHAAVAPKGDGSLVKWSCEFEKAKEETPDPDLFRDFAVKTFNDLDAYLLKA